MLGGAIVWLAIVGASGKREAWDSDLYFSAGIPAACLLAFFLGYFRPQSTWRWGVLPFAGQFVAMVVSGGFGNLAPLGLVLFGVLSLPAVAAARFGAFIASRSAKRSD
jgi:hypothetical protein